MEDDHSFFEKGRRSQFFFKWKITSIFLKIEDDLKKIMQPKTIKNKNNNVFENGRRPDFFLNRRRTDFFVKMKDDLKKQIMQPKTNKSKNNGCGTAPGNLV